jgi:hypothetical protein
MEVQKRNNDKEIYAPNDMAVFSVLIDKILSILDEKETDIQEITK